MNRSAREGKSVKRFEWSSGPDTALYKNYLLPFYLSVLFVCHPSLPVYGRVHTTALGPERFRNATGRPCSHLFHCVQSFRNEPTTSRCDRSGMVPERVRLALWCERATGPVPEPFQLPVTFVDSQPILHISKRSSLHGILPQIV